MAKVDAERQKQEDVAAQDEVEAKNRALGLSLERAVLSDRIVAGEKLEQGEDADALAYFDRASR